MKSKMSVVLIGILVMAVCLPTASSTVWVDHTQTRFEKADGSPSWLWAKGGGGYAMDYGHDIAVDPTGNSYVVGKFHGSAEFGSTRLTSFGGWDIFVAKLGADGDWEWVVSAGGIFQDEGLGITVDDEGNSYITGIFYDVAYFGNITLPSVGGLDVFVAKLDTNGNWQWAIRTGGWVGEAGYGIAVDDNGFLYVTGHFMYRADIGNTTLYSNGSADVFVAKLDSACNWLWAVRAGGPSEDYVHDIAVDGAGTVSIAGDFMGSATFGTTTLVSRGDTDVFVAQLDADGNWRWAKSAGGSSVDTALDVAVDGSGNTIITGPFSRSATFGATTLTSLGGMNVFVATLDTKGDWLWAASGGTGTSSGSWGVAVDSLGNVYVTGVFQDSASFGTTTLTSQGTKDMFVAGLDASGAWRWAIGTGGADSEEGYALAVDQHRNIYVTGYFDGSAVFGNTTLTTQGDFDVFIAKLSFDVVSFALGSGLGVRAVITNSGFEDASDVSWLIHVEGGMLGLVNKTVDGTVDTIPAGKTVTIRTGILFGFGPLTITARVGPVETTAKGMQFGILTVVNDG